MKRLSCSIGMLVVSLLVISAAMAGDSGPYIKEGVEATVRYDPLGPNNAIVAFVRFINNNTYKVHVDWEPVITCGGGNAEAGYGEPFDIDGGGSYQVNIWRTQACRDVKLEDLSVRMYVKKK